MWKLWKSAIRQSFCHPRSSKLRQPLGPWTSRLHRRHLVLSLNPPQLWDISQSTHSHHPVEYARRNRFWFSHESCPGTLPDDLIPVSLITNNDIQITVRACETNFPVHTTAPTCILDAIAALAGWKHYLLEHLHVPKCHDSVVSSLLSAPLVSATMLPTSESPPSILCTSDGGLKESHSTFGWTI